MTRKIVPFLYLVLIVLTSCESDEVTSQNNNTSNGAIKLLITPTSLEGEQYQNYSFRARVTNVPASDVNFYWDFDEGEGFQNRDKFAEYTFAIPKVHYVRCKAYDYFTDSLLAFDSIRVDIRPPVQMFELTRHLIDTALFMDTKGRVIEPLSFYVTTSIPNDFAEITWDFGDGSDPATSSPKGVSHTFPALGTYTVYAEGHNSATGLFLGRDSCTVTIRMPTFGFSSIQFAKGVEVYLAVDSTSLIMTAPFFRNPLSTKLLFKNDLVSSTTFTEPTFSVTLDSAAQPGDSRGYHLIQESIQGALSSDLKTLKTLFVTVNDTGRVSVFSGYQAALHYSFHINDLELLAVTSLAIVFRTKPGATGFADNIQFLARTFDNAPAGEFGEENSLPIEGLIDQPYALVIFRR